MLAPLVHEFFEKVTGTCQFIVACPETKEAVIIDSVLDYEPASGVITTNSADILLKCIADSGYNVKRIVETHCHADHLTASAYLKKKLNNPPICIGEGIAQVQKTFAQRLNISESEMKVDGSQFDHLWTDGEKWKLGNLDCAILNTPGHTPDSVSYLIGDSLFAGDSIFMPDVGTARCDFPGGSSTVLYESIQKLFSLPDTTKIFVGHDYPPEGRAASSSTSVSQQKAENKHVKTGSTLQEFSEWRSTRDAALGTPRLLFPSLQCNLRAGQLPSKAPNGTSFFSIPITSPANL